MIFIGLADFVEKTKNINVNDYVNIRTVIDAYHGINKGCSCQRNNRVNNANNLYNNLYSILTADEKEFLKKSLDNGEIIFQNGDSLIGKI